MEVLVAIFVTAVGLLALLALFPIGALSMYQAIKDSRCTTSAINANAVLNTYNPTGFQLRMDPNLTGNPALFLGVGGGPPNLPLIPSGPSYPVYVDPLGVTAALSTTVGDNLPQFPMFGIQRVSPQFITTVSQSYRWCALTDDMTFAQNGIPNQGLPPANFLEREDRYTWAYMMQLLDVTQPFAVTNMNCRIVVYSGRPQTSLHEAVYPPQPPSSSTFQYVSLTAGATMIQINYSGTVRPLIKAGGWILDATLTDASGAVPDPHGDFYRVVSVADDPNSANTLDLELQTPIKHSSPPPGVAGPSAGVIIIMEGVAEVFEKGPGKP